MLTIYIQAFLSDLFEMLDMVRYWFLSWRKWTLLEVVHINVDVALQYLQGLPMKRHRRGKWKPFLWGMGLCGLTDHVSISNSENILATQALKGSIFPTVLSFERKLTEMFLQKFENCNDTYHPNTVIIEQVL